jgi:hypothetical protein
VKLNILCNFRDFLNISRESGAEMIVEFFRPLVWNSIIVYSIKCRSGLPFLVGQLKGQPAENDYELIRP